MKSRKDIPFYLNGRRLFGVGVEVGVCRGSFSKVILDNWFGSTLYSIDSWQNQPSVKLDVSNLTQVQYDINFMICKERLRSFGPRSKMLRMFSVDAAKTFADKSLDFVYLDARHDYRSVDEDLRTWWPKMKPNGMFAGHDYKDSFVRNNLVEVKRAVDNFAYEFGLKVNSTSDDNLPSWYIICKQ